MIVLGARAWRLLILGLMSAPLLAVPAFASSDFVQEIGPSTPDPLALAPGMSTELRVRVQNTYGANAAVHLKATNIEHRENGCVRQEQLLEGTACADDDVGELGDWLRFTILEAGPGSAAGSVLWSGMLADLGTGVDLMARVPPGGKPELRIVTTVLAEADNRTMTDQVVYDLEWTLTSTAGEKGTSLKMDTAGGSGHSPKGADLSLVSAPDRAPWPAAVALAALAGATTVVRHRQRIFRKLRATRRSP